jgi:hypothetical protein
MANDNIIQYDNKHTEGRRYPASMQTRSKLISSLKSIAPVEEKDAAKAHI